MTASRHEFSTAFKTLVAKAIEINVIDGLDLIVMGSQFDTEEEMSSEIIEMAYCFDRKPGGVHSVLCPLFDLVTVERLQKA